MPSFAACALSGTKNAAGRNALFATARGQAVRMRLLVPCDDMRGAVCGLADVWAPAVNVVGDVAVDMDQLGVELSRLADDDLSADDRKKGAAGEEHSVADCLVPSLCPWLAVDF